MLAETPPRVHLDICFDAPHSLLQAVLQPAGQFITGPPFAAVLLQPASLRVQPPTSLQPALMHCRPTLLCNILQPASLQAHSPHHCNLHLFIAGPLSTPLQLPSLQVDSSLQVLQPASLEIHCNLHQFIALQAHTPLQCKMLRCNALQALRVNCSRPVQV